MVALYAFNELAINYQEKKLKIKSASEKYLYASFKVKFIPRYKSP
jgi:hypothetical protein